MIDILQPWLIYYNHDWYTATMIDTLQPSLIYWNHYWYTATTIDILQPLLIYYNLYWYTTTFIDILQPLLIYYNLYWYNNESHWVDLLKLVDIRFYKLIIIDVCLNFVSISIYLITNFCWINVIDVIWCWSKLLYIKVWYQYWLYINWCWLYINGCWLYISNDCDINNKLHYIIDGCSVSTILVSYRLWLHCIDRGCIVSIIVVLYQ